MSKLTTGKIIGLLVSQVKKVVTQQTSGIANVEWDDSTHSLIFTLTDGQSVSVALTINSSGVSYSN